MNKKIRTWQYALILVGLVAVIISRKLPDIEKYLVSGGLVEISAICIWMGIDYWKIQKKYVGCLLFLSALLVVYLAVKIFMNV